MVQQNKQGKSSDTQQEGTEEEQPQGVETKPGLDEDVDAILDEIDDVLETNAAEFVQNYIQKGGE